MYLGVSTDFLFIFFWAGKTLPGMCIFSQFTSPWQARQTVYFGDCHEKLHTNGSQWPMAGDHCYIQSALENYMSIPDVKSYPCSHNLGLFSLERTASGHGQLKLMTRCSFHSNTHTPNVNLHVETPQVIFLGILNQMTHLFLWKTILTVVCLICFKWCIVKST